MQTFKCTTLPELIRIRLIKYYCYQIEDLGGKKLTEKSHNFGKYPELPSQE